MATKKLKPLQQAVIAAYPDPDTAVIHTPKGVKDHGDTLLQFMVNEAGDASDVDELLGMLQRAQKDVHDVYTTLATERWKTHLEGMSITDALWWFIENVSFDEPYRAEIFFKLRERMREGT